MPQQIAVSVENNFTKGLITESTGLNFPENAATDCDNCEFTLIGDVTRRQGIDLEVNGNAYSGDRTNRTVGGYVWNNVGGDGQTRFFVQQVGSVLTFYNVSNATTASPISDQVLASTIALDSFVALGNSFDLSQEVTFADGNGYLFCYHPSCDPVYITYNSGSNTVTANSIYVKVRDFAGVNDNLASSTRPTQYSDEHFYNLLNQGWVSGNAWSATSSSAFALGDPYTSFAFTVGAGLVGVTTGQTVVITYQGSLIGWPLAGTPVANATVISYSSGVLTVGPVVPRVGGPNIPASGPWGIVPTSSGVINTFFSAANAYPSNADVWWYFKDSTGVFNPGTTLNNVSYGTGNAPAGHFIYSAFGFDRAGTTGLASITPVSTAARPTNGTWFAGRIWYTGVSSNFLPTGDATAYSWTENIYFSQIVTTPQDFGSCYQTNDPTSENLNSILPTDGGVIVIPGSGKIFKLFPIANGLIVFAANGVWFITGSQGIGFTADDYTITKLSSIQSISSFSYVDVMGLPYFWNEEGIYKVAAAQNGGSLSVEPITVGTIQTFYDNIPKLSKTYARGAYDPINYVIQWIYKTTLEGTLTDRYSFDGMLNYNIYNQAFFPYSISNNPVALNNILYVSSPTGAFDPTFKYISSRFVSPLYLLYIADEHDTSYRDWVSFVPSNYTSYFVTGYKIRGQGIKKFQPQYVQMYNRTDDAALAYNIQGIWDYATSTNSGRMSNIQNAQIYNLNYGVVHKRHKIRGRGYTLQFKVTSQDGMPFDIIGWAVIDTVNAGA